VPTGLLQKVEDVGSPLGLILMKPTEKEYRISDKYIKSMVPDEKPFVYPLQVHRLVSEKKLTSRDFGRIWSP
jgi:hypothetical protein